MTTWSRAGVPFDVIGLSYYPFFHGTLSAMRANVDDLAVRYGKPIVLAESQYPWTLANGDSTGNFVWQASQVVRRLSGHAGRPAVVLQRRALDPRPGARPIAGRGCSTGSRSGFPGVGWEPGAGSPNDNLTLFSFTGQALPSVGLFQSPLTVCAHYDPSALPCEVPDGASAAPGGA